MWQAYTMSKVTNMATMRNDHRKSRIKYPYLGGKRKEKSNTNNTDSNTNTTN